MSSSSSAPTRLAAVALAVGLVAVAGCSSGGNDAGTTTTTAPSLARSASTAADIAKRALTVDIATSDVRTYVLDLCGAATSKDHTLIDDDLKRQALTTDADLRSTISALGQGAEAYCPDGVTASPNLLNDLYRELSGTISSTTSTTTSTTLTTG